MKVTGKGKEYAKISHVSIYVIYESVIKLDKSFKDLNIDNWVLI